MTITQLIYFCECYRQESFSAASQNLYISTPSLSYSITNLENELNTSLFLRSNKGLIPTSEGHRFYQTAQKVLLDINNFQLSILSKKKINILIEKSLSLSDVLYNHLRHNYPDFLFNIQSKYSFEIYDYLISKKYDVDIIICHTTINSAMKMKEQLAIPEPYGCVQLKKCRMKVAMDKNHPLKKVLFFFWIFYHIL